MSAPFPPTEPREFHSPGWHEDARTPVVDGKYEDPLTGDICVASGAEYSGPPAVDIIVISIHEATTDCVWRASRSFKMESLLCHIAKVINDNGLEIDSINATPYAIRVILAHDLTKEDFSSIAIEMSNGLFPKE